MRIWRSFGLVFGLALASAFSCLVSSVKAEKWVTSELTRFSVGLAHPPGFKRLKGVWEEPGFQGSISAGNTDTITDGSMSVTLEGQPGCDRGVFESLWKDELQTPGSSITYKVKRNDWYVVSGVKPNGTEFYHKSWLLPDGGFTFKATYPHARNSKYDPILERMLQGFRPDVSEDVENAPHGLVTGATVSEQQAVRIVQEKLGWELPKNGRLEFDHMQEREGRNYLVVHGYELVIDDPANGTGHTATWGWYYVDAVTGAAFRWDLAGDKLIPIKKLKFN
jgi:hypothetical protein